MHDTLHLPSYTGLGADMWVPLSYEFVSYLISA